MPPTRENNYDCDADIRTAVQFAVTCLPAEAVDARRLLTDLINQRSSFPDCEWLLDECHIAVYG